MHALTAHWLQSEHVEACRWQHSM